MKNRTKTMNKTAVINNINGLSLGDRAYCGPYGIITCTKSAGYRRACACMGVVESASGKRGSRRFKVENSKRLRNGGNWTFANLRKAIGA